MKKYLFLFVISTGLCFGAAAQNGNGKGRGKGHDKEKHEKQEKEDDDDDDDDKGRHKNRKDKKHDNNSGEKYAKNAPAKVREAFNRDFPNATNVSWTKRRNIWTANFSGSIFGTNKASYTANGTRINNNSTGSSKRRTGLFGTKIPQPAN